MSRIFEFAANSSDGVFAVDRHQTIVLWNQRATEILGFSSEEVLGSKCYEVLRGPDGNGCTGCAPDCGAIASARKLEASATRDAAVWTKSGHEAWVNVSTVVVPSRRGDLSVLIHLFREVTHQHDVAAAAQRLANVVADHKTKSPKRDHAPPISSDDAHRAPSNGKSDSETKSPETAQPPSIISDTCLHLTPREQEILVCLMNGFSTERVADRLSISSRTVRNHVTNILNKLGVHSRLEAVSYALEHHLF